MDTKLSFNKLPKDVQERLRDLLDPDDDRFTFLRSNSIWIWLGVAAPLIWLAYLLWFTQSPLWEDWVFWVHVAVTVIASLILGFSVLRILRGLLSRIKNAYIFTTDEFIKVENNCVESLSLADIDALTYLETDKCIELWTGSHSQKLRVHNEYKASQLERIFSEWKSQAAGGMLAKYAKPEFAYNSGGRTLSTVSTIIVSILLGAGLSYAARGLNRSFDDEQTWKTVSSENTVQAYEDYKTKHPQGKHISEADGQASQLLGKLKADYLARAKDTADKKAVAAFGALLDSAAKEPHLTIYVRIKETRDLDNGIVDRIRKIAGVTAYSYDQALPESKTDFRKNLVFEKFKQAFGQQVSIAPVNFEAAEEAPAGSPLMEIGYTMKTDEFYYTYVTYSRNGSGQNYYPGTKFIFNFSLKPGGDVEAFETTFENAPRVLNTGAFKEENSGNYSFDAVLFGLVSDNFRNYIQSKFGFIDITNS